MLLSSFDASLLSTMVFLKIGNANTATVDVGLAIWA